jgi:5'(3')-deoxyribonucleotidase
MIMRRKRIYIDLDNTVADYLGMAEKMGVSPKDAKHIPNFFRNLKPIECAIEAYRMLEEHFDLYFLTTAPWSNHRSLMEKVEWVKEYFPTAYKNIIFSHHKDLLSGEYLIDDSTKNGAGEFEGEHIQIHSEEFPNWTSVIYFIYQRENLNL